MTIGFLIVISFGIFALRFFLRLIDKRDVAIIGFIIINAALVFLQQLAGDRYVSWLDGRYYYCTAPVAIAFLSLPIPPFPAFIGKYHSFITHLLKFTVIIAIIVSIATSIWTPIKGIFKESRRSLRSEADKWAAAIILKDYNGPKEDKNFQFRRSKYQSPRLPKVYTEDGGVNVARLANGDWAESFRNANYALLPYSASCPKGFILMAEQSFGRKYHIYKLYKKISQPK